MKNPVNHRIQLTVQRKILCFYCDGLSIICLTQFTSKVVYQLIIFINNIQQMSKRKASDSFYKQKSSNRTNSSFTEIKALASRSPYKFLQVPKVSQYAAIEKLRLSQEVLEKLKQTLYIEHVTDIQFQNRLKHGNFYINYQQNPFYKQPPESRFSPLAAQRRAASRSSNNIVSVKDKTIFDSIAKLKQKKNFDNQINRLDKIEKNANDLHMNIKENEKKYKRTLKPGKTDIFQQQKDNVQRSPQKIDHFNDFDRILGLKEENFYRKTNQRKSHNIFKLIRNKENSTFDSYQTLKKLHFCQDSTVSRPNAIKIANSFQSLSYVARMMVCGRYHLIQKEYKLASSDIKAILEEIKFRDLFMIASGMINTDILESYLENKGISSQKQEEGSSFTVNQKEIMYQEGKIHCATNFVIEHHDKVEIDGYIKNALSQVELKQQRLSQMHKQKLIGLLKQEEFCHATNVHDHHLRAQINQKMQKVLIRQFEDQIRKQTGTIDKIVRLNKMNKDKVQKLKNMAVIQSIKIKKQFEHRIKSKSRSPHRHSFSVWR